MSDIILCGCGYIMMDLSHPISHLQPTTLYRSSDCHMPTTKFSFFQNIVSPAPGLSMSSAWPGRPSRDDSNNDSVEHPQLLPELNRKRPVDSVSVAHGGSLLTSSSKPPRRLKRPKNAVRETPAFACPLYKHNPSRFGGPRGCADWCTLEIHRLYSDHLKKHAKDGDISYETLDAVKKLKPYMKDSTPEAKAAERWSLTYRCLHKVSPGDTIPSPYYQRPETSFQMAPQHSTPGPQSSGSSRHEAEQQDSISRLSLSPLPDQVARHSNRSPCQQQHPPDMQAYLHLSTPLQVIGPVIDAQDSAGRTALMRVARYGDYATARLLLDFGAAANARDENGWTPLMLAAENDHKEVVELLLARNDIDLNSKDNLGRTPLFWAAEYGHKALVELLLARNDVDPGAKDLFGQTPLSRAAENGHEALVELLLAGNDIDLNSRDHLSRTPLLWAAENGHEALVELLLARNDVDPDAKDLFGQTPLSRAAENGRKEVVKLLLARNEVDPDSKDNHDRTPLLRAAESGHEKVVKLLLARNEVDPDSKDDHDRTPLLRAAGNGHEKVVKLLLARNEVDPDSKDDHDRTPLSWAAENGHEALVEELLARNEVDPDSEDLFGQTPLSWAAENGHKEVVKLFLARNDVDPDSKDNHDRTPLSWAAQNGHTAIVELFAKRAAD